MSKVDNFIRDSYKLREDFEKTVMLIQDNETKYQGFKVVQYAMLLSENLKEISDKALKYCEDIFGIDKVMLFVKKGVYAICQDLESFERVTVAPVESFKFTFLEKRTYFGSNEMVSIIHKEFRHYGQSDVHSFALVPVIDGEEIVGAVGFYSSDVAKFTSDSNYDFLSELAIVTSIVMRKMDSVYRLALSAKTDYLTQLPNKAAMDETAIKWLARLVESDRQFAFIIVDFDNFKEINDKLGHVIGDEVLRKYAAMMKRHLGRKDVLGRFGGDEFYLFTETTNPATLKDIVQKINNDFSLIAVEKSLNCNVGASVGGVLVTREKAEQQTFIEIFKEADELLYKAKNEGGKKLVYV